MHRRNPDDSIYIDANGYLTECVVLGGQDVTLHYGDVPESDITTVDGLRCTTPLRTVIDIALETDFADLQHIVQDCLDRRLFSRDEAMTRIAEPDMLARAGAQVLRQLLDR